MTAIMAPQIGTTVSDHLPFVVGWSFTKKCNLKCIHCYNSSGQCLQNEMTLEQAKKVVDKLADFGIWAVNFGGGECILHPDFIPLCQYLREKNIEISYTTNGTLWNALKDHLHLFHDIGVSIDFADEEKHDHFRGRAGTYQRALQTIRELVNAGVNTEIVTCLNRLNGTGKELIKLYQLAKGLNVNYWRLNRFRANGRGNDNKFDLALSPEDLKLAYAFLSGLSSEVHSPDPIFRAAFGGDYFLDGDPSGQTAFRIQPDGRITPCVFLSEDAGNILDQPVEKIINSPIFQKIRNRTPKGKCRYCPAYAHCRGGDAAASYNEFGHFDGPDPLCWLTPEEEKPWPRKKAPDKCNVHELYLGTVYLPIRGEDKVGEAHD